jgi:hypothetical protein
VIDEPQLLGYYDKAAVKKENRIEQSREIQQAAHMLNNAKRPVILLGYVFHVAKLPPLNLLVFSMASDLLFNPCLVFHFYPIVYFSFLVALRDGIGDYC